MRARTAALGRIGTLGDTDHAASSRKGIHADGQPPLPMPIAFNIPFTCKESSDNVGLLIKHPERLGMQEFKKACISFFGQCYPDHRAGKGSPYKYERLSFSFHRHFWFDLKTIDVALFRQELLTVLRASTIKHENGR